MTHKHWEFDSVCPHCGNTIHRTCPVGEQVVVIHCEHCAHSYDYLHVVQEHSEVTDPPENGDVED